MTIEQCPVCKGVGYRPDTCGNPQCPFTRVAPAAPADPFQKMLAALVRAEVALGGANMAGQSLFAAPVTKEVREAIAAAEAYQAANPELLAAAKAVLQVDCDDEKWHLDPAWSRLTTAIAKAEQRGAVPWSTETIGEMRARAKATWRILRAAAFDAGAYTMDVPAVTTGRWDKLAWCNHVKFNDPWLNGFDDGK